jgi:hypothetical protein
VHPFDTDHTAGGNPGNGSGSVQNSAGAADVDAIIASRPASYDECTFRGNTADKVCLCHGTASASNPYVLICIDP